MTELYTMKLGARIKFDIWDVWRVPSGWLFAMDTGEQVMSQFVPFDNKFMIDLVTPIKSIEN